MSQQRWTPADARRFLTATINDRLSPIWHLALDAWLRRRELVELRWRDVHLDRAVLTISDTKYGRHREIAITSTTADLLRSLAPEVADQDQRPGRRCGGAGPGLDEAVLTGRDGRPMSVGALTRAFMSAQVAAQVPPIRFHDLRHSGALSALEAGVPLVAVAQRLGWNDRRAIHQLLPLMARLVGEGGGPA